MRKLGSTVWIAGTLLVGALAGLYLAIGGGGSMPRAVGGATTSVASPEASTASRPLEPQTLRVLTANIRLPAPEDVEDSWAKRRELLVKSLLAQEADIIGMQEASPAQTAYLLNNLKGYELANRNETPNTSGVGGGMLAPLNDMMGSLNQLYYRVDRFRLLAAEGGPLRPEAPQGNLTENTYYTLAVLEDAQKAFPTLIVVDTHLRHGDKNAQICAQRIHLKIAAAKLKYPQAQVVVMGDMNHGRDSEVWQQLLAAKSATELRDTHDY
ncbi:MAG: endonuclease/exonuclease/phosphatase family protein, partial [Phycisphaerae bacterium]